MPNTSSRSSSSFQHWANIQTTRLVCLMLLLGILVLVNVYFLYTIIIPSFSKIQPDPSIPSPSSPPFTPYPSPPPYYGVPDQRVPAAQRKFKSQAIDDYLALKATTMTDKDLLTLLTNCFPNTLDTTIDWYDLVYPHTFLITGDSKLFGMSLDYYRRGGWNVTQIQYSHALFFFYKYHHSSGHVDP